MDKVGAFQEWILVWNGCKEKRSDGRIK